MAERRMLHKKASVSSDLDALRRKHGHAALAWWLLMIPHLDRYGCVPADPAALKGIVCPLWEDTSPTDVKRWVAWCVKRGMLEHVTGPRGDKGLKCPRFEDHNPGAHLDREAKSPYEPPSITAAWSRNKKTPRMQGSPDLVRTKSGPSPSERSREEGSNPSSSLRSEEGSVRGEGQPARPGLVASRAGLVAEEGDREKGVPASSVEGELGGVVASILDRVRLKDEQRG